MNILYIIPATLDKKRTPVKYSKAYLPPLALAILSALTPKKHRVKVVNDVCESIDYETSWDLVGISAMTCQIDRAWQIAREFRKRKTPVIVGGVHATVFPEETLNHADSVAVGEVEDIWESVLSDAEAGTLKPIYRADQYPSLAALNIPRWETVNLAKYGRIPGQRLPMMPLFTTRGCKFQCKFCAVHKLCGNSYRSKPIANVLREIDDIGAERYFFVDDNIVCDPDYSATLFKELKTRSVRWFSQANTTIIKRPDLIDLAAESGCGSLFLGVESINRNSLISAHKGFNNVDTYTELFARLKKAGIIPFVSLIIGFDDDSAQTVEETIRFLAKNRIGFVSLFILTPAPGSDLYTEMKRDQRIICDDWSKYDALHVVFQPKNFTPQQLLDQFWAANRRHYTRRNVVRTTIENMRISSVNPIRQLLTSGTLLMQYRKNVFAYDHPFTVGLGRRLS